MARGALLGIGAVLIAAGGAAIGFAATRKPEGGPSPQARQAMTMAADQLDGDVKAAHTAVRERANTLASLQQVQAAVVTDAATAKDMLVRGELAFQPQPNEVIELGQITTGNPPVTLLVQPDGAARSPHSGTLGSFAELADDSLIITDVVSVTPKARANELSGYVTVSRPLALRPAIDRLVAAGVAGRFEVAGKQRPIGTVAPDVPMKTIALASQPDFKLVVADPVPSGGMPVPLALGGAAAAFVGLILLVAGMMKKSAAAPTQIGTAQTQLNQAGMPVAAGTPLQVDGSGPAIAPNNLGPGAMIGRWEIVKRLGSGGMADVFLARARGDAGFEKLVALKVMHPHLARNERAVQLFLDEARLAARVVHPNVVAIQDLGKIGSDYVIVMDFVDGVDLDRLLASARTGQRPVPVNVALGIMCRICDGLNAAHKATAPDGSPLNIVHRDVKSANVLVSKQGGVKVVDFGIAKAAKQSHMTVAGETKGTPSMMAPEQRVGEQVDVRADVYSTAAVAFEILTGHAVNLDLATLAHLGIENWPHLPKPSSLRAQLPAELDELLLTAMAYDRERRPADCAAFEAAFEAIMKAHNLTTTDKDIARWVSSELAQLPPSPAIEPTLAGNPAAT